MKNFKIHLTGYGEHGKDHACLYLKDKLNLSFVGSSYFCAQEFIYESIKDLFGYKSVEECFNDRRNHRDLWHNLIVLYNSEDKTKLSSKIFENNNIYCGIRCRKELDACKDKWPDLLVIWIDASERLEKESDNSCTVTKDQADIIITNNSDIPSFERKLDKLCFMLEGKVA
jgi:hypothetical protein